MIALNYLDSYQLQKVYLKKINQEENTFMSTTSWLREPIALRRKGSRLMSENKIWFMHNIREISAPLQNPVASEYFQIETHSGEELVVYQKMGDRGMKEVYLVAVKTQTS